MNPMKLTDNMLRVISHAYANNKPILFLNKAGLYDQIEDIDILKKVCEVASMIHNLTSKANTESEKEFYSFKTTAEIFAKEMNKERQGTKILTVKEIVWNSGVVYSDCLDYIYNSLSRYEPTKLDLDLHLFTISLSTTYNKLSKIANRGEAPICETDLLKEIESINNTNDLLLKEMQQVKQLNNSLYEELSNAKSKVETLNNTISTTKDNIEDVLLSIATSVPEDEESQELTKLLSTIEEEVKKQRFNLLKNQVTTIAETVKEKLASVSTDKIESKAIDSILSLINMVESNLESTINDKGYNKIVDKLNYLDDLIRNISVTNQAKTDVLDGTLDTLYSSVQRTYNRR